MISQLPGPGPYSVICPGTVGGDEPSSFSALRDALCWAQNTADAYDVQCLVTDRLGNSIELRRGSSFGPTNYCPFPRDPALSPLSPEPYFHPNPEHPRSRRRFLRNEPESFVPGGGDPRPTAARPRDFFGGTLPLMASPSLLNVWQQELLQFMQVIQLQEPGSTICLRGESCITREDAIRELTRLLESVGSGREGEDPAMDEDDVLQRQINAMRDARRQIESPGHGLLIGMGLGVGLGIGAYLLSRA